MNLLGVCGRLGAHDVGNLVTRLNDDHTSKHTPASRTAGAWIQAR